MGKQVRNSNFSYQKKNSQNVHFFQIEIAVNNFWIRHFMQRAYRGEGFSALFTFCPNCPAIISPRILGKIGAVVGVPRACQKFWGFFCLVVCSSLPDGSGRLMEGPTWQTQNVNKAEKHTPKVDAAWEKQATGASRGKQLLLMCCWLCWLHGCCKSFYVSLVYGFLGCCCCPTSL